MSRIPTVRVALLVLCVLGFSAGALTSGVRSQSSGPVNVQVIAQGVVPFTGEALDWRVYELEADPAAPREAFGAATGFTLAGEGDLLVADGDTGRRALLSPGEAALSVDGDVIEIDAAADDEAASYTRIALLPDDFTDAGGTEPAYVSDDFDSPSGDRDVSLVRGLLGEGEEASLPRSEAPTLLLVTGGEVAVTYGESDGETPLSAGEALGVDGPAFVAHVGDEPAVFVAAVIGERVAGDDGFRPDTDADDATPGASPEADGDGGETADGTGTLSFVVEVCPLGGVAEGCEARSDVALIEVTGPGLIDGPILSYDAAVADDGSVAFGGLPYGGYAFQIVDQAVPGELLVGGDVVSDEARPGVYTLTVDAEAPAPVVTISILPATGEGSIAVAFYRCPASLPVEQAAVWYCGADPTGWDLTLSGTTIGGDLLLVDAPGTGDGAVFSGLPLDGVYALELTSVPEDVATVGVRPGLVAEGPIRVELSGDAPDQAVTYLGIVEGETLSPSGDADGDGLVDNYETDVYGTDPTVENTDGVPSPDAKEVSDGTDPRDAESYAFG